MISVDIPKAYAFLAQPARYKVTHGGRGKAASWSYARALLIKGMEKKLRVLCAREIQQSIKDSVHKLLKEQIETLGLSKFYSVNDRAISGINGTEFLFEGLFRNVNRIKSLEGIDIAWVEEAEKVSDESWDILIPTIRKDGSEIWINFNPQFEDDATYKRFVVNPPEGAVVRQINYPDNPYFPEVLKQEMEQDKARDKAKYENIWLGKPHGTGRKVWHAFNRDIHVQHIPMQEIADKGNCYMAMDPHSHYYPFCLWVAILPNNERRRWPEDFRKHFYAEWPTVEDLGGQYHEQRTKLLYKGGLADLAREIQAKDGAGHGIVAKARFIDPRYAKGAGSWNYSTNTEGIIQQFAKRENGGLLFIPPNETVLGAQKDAIHQDMLWNPNLPQGDFNGPKFSVDPACKNLIMSLLNHRLEDGAEKESEKYKDASDTMRIAYAGMDGVEYEDPRQPVAGVLTLTVPSASSGFAL